MTSKDFTLHCAQQLRVTARAERHGVCWAGLAAVLACASPAQAQLPVGGFLGAEPVEENVEERIQGQLERVTELNIQENIDENIEEALEASIDAAVESGVEAVVEVGVQEAL